MSNHTLPQRVRTTRQQEEAMTEARISFMKFCPFFCYYFYDQMEEYVTYEVDTLATDGRRVFVNPDYFMKLTPMERAFGYAHEVNHVILKHPQRAMNYAKLGNVRGIPYDHHQFNMALDYPINAHLVDIKAGACNPSWLYDPQFKADDLAEDVYAKIYVPPPPPPVGPTPPPGDCENPSGRPGNSNLPPVPTNGSGGQPLPPNQSGGHEPKTYGDNQKGGARDKTADGNDGRMDEVMEPYEDPATGEVDLPSDTEFQESVARAAAAAKAIGNFPGSMQRYVDEILNPQVNWRDHIRMVLTGRLGQSRETWDTPNRRRIVLNPAIYLPGRKGHGCEDVTVVIDNSGSIAQAELDTFFSEVTAILADCKPRKVRVIWCDWEVRQVEEARCLDELIHIRCEGAPGGGGTRFEPPFEWLEERDIRPDAVVYLSDGYGSFPQDPKVYPTVWCLTTDVQPPFGDAVRITVS